MLPRTDDTIAAIATAPGIGGIGVLRISGPAAAAVLGRLFQPRRPEVLEQDGSLPSHRLCYGTVRDRQGAVLDEVMAVFMRAPHTYTREDVAEIQCHGSYLVQQAILAEILAVGARAAEPGEFTVSIGSSSADALLEEHFLLKARGEPERSAGKP